MDQIKIGKFIAKCRKDRNLTQEQLAEKLGTTNKSVSKWENGICLPDSSLYEMLCEILNISINELFSGQRIKNDNYKSIADKNLLDILKHSMYDQNKPEISYEEFDNALDILSQIVTVLSNFKTKQEAVAYLMKELNIPEEECSNYYDFYMNINKKY